MDRGSDTGRLIGVAVAAAAGTAALLVAGYAAKVAVDNYVPYKVGAAWLACWRECVCVCVLRERCLHLSMCALQHAHTTTATTQTPNRPTYRPKNSTTTGPAP